MWNDVAAVVVCRVEKSLGDAEGLSSCVDAPACPCAALDCKGSSQVLFSTALLPTLSSLFVPRMWETACLCEGISCVVVTGVSKRLLAIEGSVSDAS